MAEAETTITVALDLEPALKKLIDGPKAFADVLRERVRQIEKEGWTPAHDDQHVDGELASAAACYVTTVASVQRVRKHAPPEVAAELPLTAEQYRSLLQPSHLWPWDPSWWKPKDPRRDLVRAAALIIAEIERIDRAAAKTP